MLIDTQAQSFIDSLSPAVLSSWFAALVSATSAGFVFWKFWYEREHVEWIADETKLLGSIRQFLTGHPYASLINEEQVIQEFHNIGDGQALNVEVASPDCVVFLFRRDSSDPRGVRPMKRVALVRPGESMALAVLPTWAVSEPARSTERPPSATMSTVEQERPDRILVKISWTRRPARAKRRSSQTFRVDGDALVPTEAE